LFGFGLNVQMCFVHTSDHLGAYDWFCLKGARSSARVRAWLERPEVASAAPRAPFESVELTARDAGEWTFSLRGRDQRGLLLSAARAISDLGLGLRWARVHTWGQQVEDVFGVTPLGDADEVLARLKARVIF
jgi:[protein-PII] uridylyltransferase